MKCEKELDTRTMRPSVDTFYRYIPFFLNDIPNELCAKAGKPSYGDVSTLTHIAN